MTNEELHADLKKEIRAIKRGSDIQTAALVLIFFFGITSLADLIERVKK